MTAQQGGGPGPAVQYAVDTLDLAVKGATAYGRLDLVERLDTARGLLSGASVTVSVVGEFKQGKSSLVNALVTQDVCPVDDDIATCVPTSVRHSPQPRAVVTFEPGEEAWATTRSEEVPIADVAAYVTESGNAGNRRRVRSVVLGVDRPLLRAGMVLVDTPGVGGLGSVHHAVTVGALPQAHAVVVVTDASQELTASELRFLSTVRELCPSVVLALTKIDLYPEWRRILDLDRAHLARAGVEVEALAVSSELRSEAARDGDQDLNVESGYPPLVQLLHGVVRDAEHTALRTVGHHVLSVVDQVEPALVARIDAATHPERTAELVARLEAAQRHAEGLRDRASRWQQVLSDGFADLGADVDFDLRQRSRTAMQEAEKAIDDGDPAKNWAEFETWLRQRLAGEALDTYAGFTTRAREVAGHIAEHFEIAEAQVVPPTPVDAPVHLVDGIAVDGTFAETPKRMAGGMAGFQKAYGGFLMFTMLTHMASLALPGPLGIGVGLLMGKAGIGEERKRQLEKRRAAAKTAVRRFVDEFNLHVGKDLRDAVRHVQRELRDGYAGRAEELGRSAREALAAAQRAVAGDETEASELTRLRGDLESFALLRTRATELARHSTPRVAPRPAVPAGAS